MEQERIKSEKLEVTYSYWDGSGHRRTIAVTKGQTIGKFLEAVRMSISADFHELRTMSAESLLYIKEDLIIPSHFSFYDMIVTKARGKRVRGQTETKIRNCPWGGAPALASPLSFFLPPAPLFSSRGFAACARASLLSLCVCVFAALFFLRCVVCDLFSPTTGKSGPLFHFDVHDDVRLGGIDARIEKDESHPGKIVQRGWCV